MYKKAIAIIILILLITSIFTLCGEYLRVYTGVTTYYMSVKPDHIKVLNKDKKILGIIKIAEIEILIDYDLGDLTNDDKPELVLLKGIDGNLNKILEVYELIDNKFEYMYSRTFKTMNPWKVEICNIDDNSYKELSIGMYKETRFHPVMAKRPYIYFFKDKNMYPKWRGSRLARPFDDYIFFDIDSDGMDEIVSIENSKNGRKVISTYEWIGFGFEGIKDSEEFNNINSMEEKEDHVLIEIEKEDMSIEFIEIKCLNDL